MLQRSSSAIALLVLVCSFACGDADDAPATSSAQPSEPPSLVLVAPKDDGPKTVFVTNGIFSGALGGLAGADAKCQTEADAAGLTGTYRAWISSAEASAVGRLDHDTGPYVLVTGEVVARSFRGLASGTLEHAIDRTATGAEPPPSFGETICGGNLVWTSTRDSGNFTGSDCNGWTTDAVDPESWPMLGIAGATSRQWTEWCSGPKCNFEAHLYCIEQ